MRARVLQPRFTAAAASTRAMRRYDYLPSGVKVTLMRSHPSLPLAR